MLADYLPILIQVIVAVGFAAVTLLISVMLGKAAKRNPTKDSAYECGMLPIGPTAPRFSVKFYLVAMLFILFDIEAVFLYPWAVVYQEYIATRGPLIFISMAAFITILFTGYLYALKKGALEWK